MSQHIGDVENYETIKFFEESLANLKAVYRADPKIIVHDLHPGYLSTKWAMEQESMGRGREVGESAIPVPHAGIRLFGIQHHYAHIGSVMAENGLKQKVIGVAFDGTGYGTDGNLWGGEFLIAGIETFERAAHFNYLSLPGGEAAIREPWKTAVSLIMQAAGPATRDSLDRIGFIEKYGQDSVEKVMLVARSRELSPLSSGAGRLFDAVSALLGVCDKNTFEGEAAMALEACTREGIEAAYEFRLIEDRGMIAVDFGPAVMEIMEEMVRATSREIMAVKFHNTVVAVIQTLVRRIRADRGIHDVALSGGVFQNQYLLNRAVRLLSGDGFGVFVNRKVPCNDGGISLGQAYLVRERLKNRESIGL
jgi:hydrogenase maturation protein HypF